VPTKSLLISTLLFTILLSSQSITQTLAITATLTLNLDTNKKIYRVGEDIQIYGTLFYEWGSSLPRIPVEDVVTLQVNYPSTYGIHMLRTLATGSLEFKTWSVEILQLTPCDQGGNSKESFMRGTIAYFKVEWKNNDNVSRYVMIIFTLCYGNGRPFAVFSPTSGTLAPNETRLGVFPVPISTDATIGPAKIYASALSDLPSNNGYPYCPEKTAGFTITTTSSLATYTENQTANLIQAEVSASYNLTFPTPIGIIGNYTVYASSRLLGTRQATNTTTFEVIPLIGDVNLDGMVNMLDYQLVKKAIPSMPGDPKWNPYADINNDGVVNMLDFQIVKMHVGEHA
jgi:hypothetical protein